LKARFDEVAQIKAGKSGQFDVIVDGRLIFSKDALGRFPEEEEIEREFEKLRSAPSR
jgi:predicted Rdx family selenoprotein